MNTDEAKPTELTDNDWAFIEIAIREYFDEGLSTGYGSRDEFIAVLRRLRAAPTIRDLHDWLLEQPIRFQLLAVMLIEGGTDGIAEYAQEIINLGAVDAWIKCAAAGETAEAINQLIATIAEWKEAKDAEVFP